MKVWEVVEEVKGKVHLRDLITYAREIFRETKAECLPVYDEKTGKYVGFITDADVLVVTSDKSNLCVREVVRELPVITADMEVEDAVKILREHNLTEVPVIDSPETKNVIGIFSLRRLLRILRVLGFSPKATTVREVMTKEVHYVTPDERVNRAWSKIVYKGVKTIVVVSSPEEKRPVGIVTVRDFIESGRWYFRREAEKPVSTPAKVSTIMTRGVLVATPDIPIDLVAEILTEYNFHALPVIDSEGRLIGLVTIDDVVRAYIEGKKPEYPPVVKPAVVVPIEEKVEYVTAEQRLAQVLVKREEAAPPPKEIFAVDVLRTEMPAVKITDTLEHAVKELLRRRTKYLLVVDENDQIIGIISTKNILRAISIRGPYWKRRFIEATFIHEVLSKNVPKVPKKATIEEIALEMFSNDIDVVFVVDEKGEIAGFVTKEDLVKAFAEKYSENLRVEHLVMAGRVSIVHPHHSYAHAIRKMKAYYRDALVVCEGDRIFGVISESHLPFIAFEDVTKGLRSRRLIWVRRRGKAQEKSGGYVEIRPLLAEDLMVKLPEHVKVTPSQPVRDAIELMFEYNVDGIPVVEEDGGVIGVICKNDIIRELARHVKPLVKVPPAIEEKVETREKTSSA